MNGKSEPDTTRATHAGHHGSREDWLDALRCIAILGVVFVHFSGFLLPDWLTSVQRVFNLGTFVMTLFFLITGYVTPISLERGTDMRQFWIARVFRLYPLLVVALVPILVVGWLGRSLLPDGASMRLTPPELWQDPFTTILANGTMLQYLLGVPSLIPGLWFLSFWMAFYLLVTVLVVGKLHRFNTEIALGLATISLFAGGLLPSGGLASGLSAARTLTIAATLLLIIALAGIFNRRRWAIIVGAVTLGGLVFALLAFNQPEGPWYGCSVLALMFAAAGLCQARLGQISRSRAIAVFVTVLVCTGAAGGIHRDLWLLDNGPVMAAGLRWAVGILSAGLVFTAMLLLRDRRLPRFLTWTGQISYSIFFLHFGLIFAAVPWWYTPVREGSAYIKIAALTVFMAVLLPCSHLGYKWIEMPGQRLGRRVAERQKRSSRPRTTERQLHSEVRIPTP